MHGSILVVVLGCFLNLYGMVSAADESNWCPPSNGKTNKWKSLKYMKKLWVANANDCRRECYQSSDCNFWKMTSDWTIIIPSGGRRRRDLHVRSKREQTWFYPCYSMKYGGEDKIKDHDNDAVGSRYCEPNNPIPQPINGECYDDKTSDHDGNRLLPTKIASNNDMTVGICVNSCRDRGYKYAGLENEKECWCGSVWPNWARKLPDSKCNKTCKGDKDIDCSMCNISKCGDNWTITVWNV